MADVTDTQGTRLRRGGTLIPKVYSVGSLAFTMGLRDVTSLEDTIHQHKLGIPDMNEIPCKIWFDAQESTHLAIFQDAINRSLGVWQVDMEEGNSPNENVTFTAYVINPTIEAAEVDGDYTLSFSLKPQSMFVGLFD
jgi:hypothetical protein